MNEPLFKVTNHHTPACGKPLAVDADEPSAYYGYSENEHGEQAVYVYDYKSSEATLRLGDAGWDRAHRVVDGRAEGVMLSESEMFWLRACWLATGGLRREDPAPGG